MTGEWAGRASLSWDGYWQLVSGSGKGEHGATMLRAPGSTNSAVRWIHGTTPVPLHPVAELAEPVHTKAQLGQPGAGRGVARQGAATLGQLPSLLDALRAQKFPQLQCAVCVPCECRGLIGVHTAILHKSAAAWRRRPL
jgi:hypothetical protein